MSLAEPRPPRSSAKPIRLESPDQPDQPEAPALHARSGCQRRGPVGGDRDDTLGVFMGKSLAA